MKHISIIIIGIVAITIIGAFFLRQDPGVHNTGETAVSHEGTPRSLGQVPETTIETPNGAEVGFPEVLERNTIVNMWASWCPFCVDELPDFAEFAREHTGEIDVIVVNRAEPVRKGQDYLQDLGLTNSALRVFYDSDESLYRALGGFSMPETVFIDASGEIRFHKRGPLSKSELERITGDLGWRE